VVAVPPHERAAEQLGQLLLQDAAPRRAPKFAARLEPLFPDFDAQFPKPQAIIQAERQPGLFD